MRPNLIKRGSPGGIWLQEIARRSPEGRPDALHSEIELLPPSLLGNLKFHRRSGGDGIDAKEICLPPR
jgi:hypothetical protein